MKRLFPRGTGLHARVPRRSKDARKHSPFHVNEYGTPLDILFEFSGTPDEYNILGTEWLEFLASKGHDVVVYLKKRDDVALTTASTDASHLLLPSGISATYVSCDL